MYPRELRKVLVKLLSDSALRAWLADLGLSRGDLAEIPGPAAPFGAVVDEALQLADGGGFRLLAHRARNAIAEVLLEPGQFERVESMTRETLASASAPEICDAWGCVDALQLLGVARMALGHRAEAVSTLERARDYRRRIGHPGWIETDLLLFESFGISDG